MIIDISYGGNQMEWKEKEWAKQIAEKIRKKEQIVALRSDGKIPYTTVNGRFDDWTDRIGWWTNGFYAGQMWLLYYVYKEDLFRKTAENIEEKLDKNLMEYMAMDHDNGFKWLLTSAANYKLTGNEMSKNRALLAAANLAGRYNPKGHFIRAWNDSGNGDTAGWAIIDCMMNLPLLYWASKQTNDKRFTQIAKFHADMVSREYIREDGSSYHIMTFDPESGEKIKPLGGQGMDENSSWTRGQAWALYGFALSYNYTKEKRYLETAEKVAVYIQQELLKWEFVPVDFAQKKDVLWEDSSAAAIMACGFLELEQWIKSKERKTTFHKTAISLLRTLEEKRCNLTEETDFIIENCSVAYHEKEHNVSLIYADYYFTEAILRLSDGIMKGVD